MNTIWIIIKIATYTFILNIVFRQTYNFIFLIWRMPTAWIGIVTSLGIANVILAFELSWDPGIVSSAVSFLLLLNWPPPIPKGMIKVTANQWIDSVYAELGIVRGRLKYRLGLPLFALFSAVTYVLLFAESCPIEGKCSPLLHFL
jgi:hypothetical protein